MMLRILCLLALSLFYSSQCSFCYNYYFDNDKAVDNKPHYGSTSRNQYHDETVRRRSGKFQKKKYRNRATIDVSDFLQSSNEENPYLNDPLFSDIHQLQYRSDNRGRTGRDYAEYESQKRLDGTRNSKPNTDELSSVLFPSDNKVRDIPLMREKVGAKRYNLASFSDSQSDQKSRPVQLKAPEHEKVTVKKSADEKSVTVDTSTAKLNSFRKMKFPFFSRDKSETPKPKRKKKRKLFSFSCQKKEDGNSKSTTESDLRMSSQHDAVTQRTYVKFEKRSNVQNILLCPVCSKKFYADAASLSPRDLSIRLNEIAAPNESNSKKLQLVYDDRIKREDADAMRMRQMKELEQVEEKINAIKTKDNPDTK